MTAIPRFTRDDSGFRHRLRVRIGGIDGPKGRLYHCDGRQGKFWKVRLDTGEWVWPDRLVVDGPGDHYNHACLDCRLPFKGDVGDLLCQACQETVRGEEPVDSGHGIRSDTYHRRRWASRHR